MRFVIGNSVSDSSNSGPVPSKLKDVNWPPQKNTIDHVFNFQHGGDNIWTINGEAFDDINNRILARPPQVSSPYMALTMDTYANNSTLAGHG